MVVYLIRKMDEASAVACSSAAADEEDDAAAAALRASMRVTAATAHWR